jgi:molecular chaperone GrpE
MENPFKKAVENSEELDINIENKEEPSAEENKEVTEEITKEVVEEPVQEDKNEWKEKYETLNNQYLRLAADFDNFRKRQEAEKESLLKYGAENTVKKLIEVIDNFDRGMKAIETVEDCEKVKECYQLAYKNFNDVLGKIGLEVIPAEGEEFDPNLHEAVMQTPTDEKPENTIIAELQKGYKLGDKVLRPTLVNVATAP